MMVRSRNPYYQLSDIVKSCSVSGKVRVRKQAKDDAKNFGFETEKRIIDFISLNEFEDIRFDNSDTLDHDPDKGTPFDAYIFKIGPKYVYFAFYQRPNGSWIIKSFHTPCLGEKAPQLSHLPFKLLGEMKK